MSIRIVIVDDHHVVRQGLRMFLELDPAIEVVGEAANGEEALRAVAELRPEIVLMDLLMPRMNGIEAIRALRQSHPQVQTIALTSVLDDQSVLQAVRSGAVGYLLKDTQAEDLCRAIHEAAQGRVQLSPEAAARLVREVRGDEMPIEALTTRERDVLERIAAGQSNKEIAAGLNIVEKTVKTHVSNLMAKLGVQSRTQAALYAVQRGWTRT